MYFCIMGKKIKQTTKDKEIEVRDKKRDYQKFFVEKGEPGFNPAHNNYIIDKTIREYEANLKRKHKEYVDKFRERADAVDTYLRSRLLEGTPIEKYFGKRWLAYLRGEKIVQKLKTNIPTKGVRTVHLPKDI